MNDTYSRVLLTLIAVALVTIALRGGSPVPTARAGETMECRFSGPLEISRIQGTVEVEISQGFSQPGTSSSRPLYVEVGK